MRCYNCHGDVEGLTNHCPHCGCDRDAALGASENLAAHTAIDKSYAIADIIMPALVFGPIALMAVVLTAIFGDEPEKLLFGFSILVGLAALCVCVYGIVYQCKHNAKLHHPSTKIATGKIIDCRSPHRGLDLIIVEFEANGKKYRHVSKNRDGAEIESGKKIDIAYNYHNPFNNFVAKDHRGYIMIFSTLFVVILFGAIIIWSSSKIGGGPLLKA